jgi:hypothetical protein
MFWELVIYLPIIPTEHAYKAAVMGNTHRDIQY